jgi:hypothetical protein
VDCLLGQTFVGVSKKNLEERSPNGHSQNLENRNSQEGYLRVGFKSRVYPADPGRQNEAGETKEVQILGGNVWTDTTDYLEA